MTMFDNDTGQVFKEWVVPRKSISAQPERLDWSRRRLYPSLPSRGTHGPRSLVDMTINIIANNIGDVTDAHFDAIPARLLWRIWRFLEARGACFHAWKLFSKILLDDDEDKNLGIYRFRQHLCHPTDELRQYTLPMDSPSLDFVTHLVISGGCTFTPHEMLCLAEMRNLGALELVQPADEVRGEFPQISDRLIRGWTEKDDPFPLLRILRIWGDQTTTQDSLQWVSKFPSLAVYDVMGARGDWRLPHQFALNAGWEMAEPISGLEDSILRHLILLANPEEMASNGLKEIARGVDSDLISVCGDSRCAVKFMSSRQAPPLLDYLTTNAKAYPPSWDTDGDLRAARACHGIAFEPWSFWLYSFLGQLGHDNDLRRRGRDSETQAVVGPFVLPSRPMACFYLGHSGRGGITTKPSYVSRGLFATKRFTFTRSTVLQQSGEKELDPPKEEIPRKAPPSPKPTLNPRHQKKRRLEDLLDSLSR